MAGEAARFSEIFAKRGLSLDGGGSWLLPRLIGLHKAKELAFFGDVISSAEAERIGIVNHVVPDADLDKFVDEWALRLTQLPPIALSMTKTHAEQLADDVDGTSARRRVAGADGQLRTDDTAEAMRAFVTKTTPTFKGR